jgi:predicted N-acetyltransferase YhbS
MVRAASVVVHPRLQRRGLGARPVREIEERSPEAERYGVFSGHLSQYSLRLYRLGKKYASKRSRLRLIHLKKSRR